MRRDMPALWLWWTGTWAGAVVGPWCGTVLGALVVWEGTPLSELSVADLRDALRVAFWLGAPVGLVAGLLVGSLGGVLAVLMVACVPRRVSPGAGTGLVVAVVAVLVVVLLVPGHGGVLIAGLIGGYGLVPFAVAIFLVLSDRREALPA